VLLRPCSSGFTLIELLIVISIIIVLAGLTIGTMGYVQEKGKRSRAEAEIAAISAALESYKADNGIYPKDGNTDGVDPTSSVDPANYLTAANTLYQQLSGDQDFVQGTTNDDTKNYIGALMKPSSLATPSGAKPYLKDPWGNAYGYSTSKAAGNNGYNPTYDLWSTAGSTKSTDVPKWIKNW
jgi:prepilin-type N-terminal cleavage/methylation domain-containing protein